MCIANNISIVDSKVVYFEQYQKKGPATYRFDDHMTMQSIRKRLGANKFLGNSSSLEVHSFKWHLLSGMTCH